MKNVLKHKKLIAFILVFTISFGVVTSYKQKETHAIVIADDLLFWVLGSLVLATGVVAVSSGQITDMGAMVKDRLDNLGQDIEYIERGANITGLKIGNALVNAIDWVAERLPTIDKSVETPKSWTQGNLLGSGNESQKKVEDMTNIITATVQNVGSNVSIFTVNGNSQTSTYNRLELCATRSGDLTFSARVVPYNGAYGVEVTCSHGSHIVRTFQKGTMMNFGFYSNYILTGNWNSISSIPYSNPTIRENYNEEKRPVTLPFNDYKQGFYPIPSSIPSDVPISTESPLTFDSIKDNVTDLTDTGTGGELDPDPNDDSVPDLWKWLARLLRFIFSPFREIKEMLSPFFDFVASQFTELINNIKNIPNVFSQFFENLGLKISNLPSLLTSPFRELFKELFIPDLPPGAIFNFPEGSLFGNIRELFNFDSLFTITPKPIEFETSIPYGLGENKKTWDISLKPFSLPYINNNLEIFRNVMSYSVLIMVLWAITHHLLPKRDMD